MPSVERAAPCAARARASCSARRHFRLAQELRQQSPPSPTDREVARYSGQKDPHISPPRFLKDGFDPGPIRCAPKRGLRGGEESIQVIQIKTPVGADEMDVKIVVFPSHRLDVGRFVCVSAFGYESLEPGMGNLGESVELLVSFFKG